MTLVSTLLQNLRVQYPSNLDKNEHRESRYGVLRTYQADTNAVGSIVSSDLLEKASRSIGRTLQVPVVDGENVSIGNVRACTIADAENTSAFVNVTFATYSFGFTMYPAQHFNNEIDYQQDFDKKMNKFLLKLAATLDTDAHTSLDAAKTVVMNSALVGAGAKYGALVGDTIQVTQAQKGLFLNDMESIMNSDDFYENYNVIGSTGLNPVVSNLVNQGNANSANTAFQFGPYDFSYSNRVVDGAGMEATMFVVPKGQLGILNRNGRDSILGSKSTSGKTWGLVRLPLVDMEFGTMHFSDCNDANALHAGTADMTATNKEFFMFHTDVAFIEAYNRDSATLAGAIHKAEIAI